MANDLTRNSALIHDDVRQVKSKAKEDVLLASTQVWDKGIRIWVRYGDVGYNKITNGIDTFSDLPKVGEGGGGVQSVTGDGVGGTPENPVLSYPTPEDIGAISTEQNAFNLEDVTQQFYTDKAINVIPFNNSGMGYREGSIDFGITRNFPHTMGLYAFKQGAETTASGSYSSAFGTRTIASGTASSAFGNSTIASGDYSSAFGSGTTASGDYSSAFGFQSIANEYASLAIGRFSTGVAVETSWTPGSPVFKVGNGADAVNRSNAYVLYNDGRSEQVKDIEVTEIGQGVVLKSPDGTRWRITVDDSGDLTTTAL